MQAADLSVRAARQFNDWSHWLRAINLYSDAGRLDRAASLFAEAQTRWPQQAAQEARLFAVRAAYEREQGQTVAALADYQRWLALDPSSADARQSIIWLLIDMHDATRLRELLALHEVEWARDAKLHDALGAAWLTLSVPRVALEHYLAPHMKEHRGDFLWLMNYADALEQDQQVDAAWRLRELLWRERKMAAPKDAAPAETTDKALREARVRLVLSRQPGDASLAALRELLRLDRDAKVAPGGVSDELLISWLMAQSENEAAHAYMWSRYANRLSEPEWASLALALAQGDTTREAELLAGRERPLPRYDAINAAQAIGAPGLAATMAFDSQTLQRDDEPLQLQLSEVLLDQSPRVEAGVENRHFNQWSEHELYTGFESQLLPSLRLKLDVGRIERKVDPTQFNMPNERYLDMLFTHHDGNIDTKFGIGARNSFAGWMPLSFSRTLFAGATGNLDLVLGWRQPTTESLALRALGWRNSLELNGNYLVTLDDRLNLGVQLARYQAQNGLSLGSGRHVEAAFTHSLRRETRQADLQVFWSYNQFKVRDTFSSAPRLDAVAAHLAGDASEEERVATLMPQSFNLYGIRLSSETALEQLWRRGRGVPTAPSR